MVQGFGHQQSIGLGPGFFVVSITTPPQKKQYDPTGLGRVRVGMFLHYVTMCQNLAITPLTKGKDTQLIAEILHQLISSSLSPDLRVSFIPGGAGF